MIWEAIILAVGIVAAAAIISNTIENLVVDLAQDIFSRWDAMIYEDDED
ncbi:hypothetical protein [Bradyrhizobium sp. th.b2]|nr:hypothetical protein [Bradyrhizobium sp. th.b2]